MTPSGIEPATCRFVAYCSLYIKIFKLYGSYTFILHIYVLTLYGFCIDMPENGLSTGRNMLHTCKGY